MNKAIALGVLMVFQTIIFAHGQMALELAEDWRFHPDSNEEGVASGWHTPGFDDSAWPVLRAGVRWEDQGYADLDGKAWYRRRVTLPPDMQGKAVWLNLGGINDAGVVYCNGVKVGAYGDKGTVSAAKMPVVLELSQYLEPSGENLIAVEVFDWGRSGGLVSEPVSLTADHPDLDEQSLVQCAPVPAARRLIVGVNALSLGGNEEPPVSGAVSINGGTPMRCAATIQKDRVGQPVAVMVFEELKAQPGDSMRVTVRPRWEDRTPLVLEKTFKWPYTPHWEGKYRKLKVLNNFVTELKVINEVRRQKARASFLNPREGWVFVSVAGASGNPEAYIDDGASPLTWRPHSTTGALEAFCLLSEGKHRLRLIHAAGARVDVRAVPESSFCYYPTRPVLRGLPPIDEAFAERYVFPNCTTLLTHDDMTAEEFDAWRAEGRTWLSNSSLPGLSDANAPTADAVYDVWAKNAVVTRPGYAGLIVDEFLGSSAEHYAAWTEATKRLYAQPSFAGKTFYAWVVNTYQHPPGLEYMKVLPDLGGRFAWERYFREESTEELALLAIQRQLVSSLAEWEEVMPGVNSRLSLCLGSFSTPWCSLNVDPSANYLAFLEHQYRVAATDPQLFGVYGIFEWAAHYTDNDVLRYAMALRRHYCIEGKQAPLGSFTYELPYLENPDFADGLTSWRVEAAEGGAVAPVNFTKLGRIQGRWAEVGCGDAAVAMIRSASGPNRVAQRVRDLVPGRLYSLKFIGIDLDNIFTNAEVGPWARLEGASIVEKGSFRSVMLAPYNLEYEGAKRGHLPYTTYNQILFRPEGEIVKLTFSDWKSDAEPGGPAGQRIGFNFVEILPYYEE